jgi:hypothetical protein
MRVELFLVVGFCCCSLPLLSSVLSSLLCRLLYSYSIVSFLLCTTREHKERKRKPEKVEMRTSAPCVNFVMILSQLLPGIVSSRPRTLPMSSRSWKIGVVEKRGKTESRPNSTAKHAKTASGSVQGAGSKRMRRVGFEPTPIARCEISTARCREVIGRDAELESHVLDHSTIVPF